MNTAQVILSQIKSLDPRALFAWGARDLVDTGGGLKFKTSGLTAWRGWVWIKYNQATDLYDIDFFKIRKLAVVNSGSATGIYAEDLVDVIDRRVG